MLAQNSTTMKEENFFSNVYNYDLYLGFAVAFGCFDFFVLTPFLYLIIWYERFGSDHPRSIINQLVASTCWNGIANGLVIIPLEIFQSLSGPVCKNFCLLLFVLKTSILIHQHLMIVFITCSKYMSIFVLKNPTEIISEFWCLFLNLFSLLLAMFSQITLALLPGKRPIYMHICMGTDPRIDDKYPAKIGIVLPLIGVFVILSYILLCLKVKLMSYYTPHTTLKTPKQTGWQLPTLKDVLENNSMASLGTIGFFILILLPTWLIHFVMLKLSPEKLATHPYQIITHFHQHGHRFVFNLLTALWFLSRSHIRRSVLRELSEIFSRLIEIFG